MNKSTYTFRSYKHPDFDRYARLKSEAERLKPDSRRISPQMIAENLSAPGCSPEQSIFVVEIGDDIAGYIDLNPELAIGRVILDCWVEPEHRGKGLATKLFERALQRAGELGVRIAHVNIVEDNDPARSALSKLGFSPVRKYLELRLDINEAQIPAVDQADTACRPLQYSEEEILARVQNLAFAGTWGYNPNTVEEIRYHLKRSYASPEDVMLTCEGDGITGYCWTGITGEEGDAEKTGRIFMIGVDPEYRGKGIGRRVLLAGLAHLKSKGLRYVELTVDSENSVACALYRSLGFITVTASLWYEKAVAQDTGTQ